MVETQTRAGPLKKLNFIGFLGLPVLASENPSLSATPRRPWLTGEAVPLRPDRTRLALRTGCTSGRTRRPPARSSSACPRRNVPIFLHHSYSLPLDGMAVVEKNGQRVLGAIERHAHRRPFVAGIDTKMFDERPLQVVRARPLFRVWCLVRTSAELIVGRFHLSRISPEWFCRRDPSTAQPLWAGLATRPSHCRKGACRLRAPARSAGICRRQQKWPFP